VGDFNGLFTDFKDATDISQAAKTPNLYTERYSGNKLVSFSGKNLATPGTKIQNHV
jgi:hypothetical protein